MKLKLPRYYDKLSKEHQERWNDLNACFENLSREYSPSSAGNPTIFDFHLINSKRKPKYFKSWTVARGSFQFTLSLIEYEIRWEEVSRGHVYVSSRIVSDTHKYFFGHLDINSDYGVTLMRPERLTDKLSELFGSVELDFREDRKFSRKYYVLSNDEKKLRQNMNPKLMEYLSSVKNLELEFRNKSCMFRLPKAANVVESRALCEIGLKLDEILNSANP